MLFGSVISCSYLQKQFVRFRLSSVAEKPAQKVRFTAPPSPYKLEKAENLDKFWRHKEDHSSISYFSSCSKEKRQLSLQDIQEDVLSEVPEWEILDTKLSPQTLQSHVQIKGENYKSIGSIYIFQKGNCFFVLNFVAGSLAVFKKNKPLFENFIKSFKAF